LWYLLHYTVALRLQFPTTPILILKFDVNRAFKRLALNFSSTLKTIVTLGSLAYISIRSTFGGKSSCSIFSLLAELMYDLMNKIFNTNRLSALHLSLSYIDYHEEPIKFSSEISFTPAEPLLFDIPTNNNRFVNLYADNFINIYLNKIVDRIHEATRCFNIITNLFDLFFSNVITKLSNKVKQKIAISLRNLKGEGTLSELKKVLGWMIDTRYLLIALL